MSRAETEEFEAVVKLRLIENDYAVLRKFEGRSTFGTFITAVVSRLLKDHRDHEWGKWRNSAEAKRLGPLAMELERMLLRDQRTLQEAFVELAPKYPGTARSLLEQLADRFPQRHRRRLVSLDERPDVIADPDGEIETTQIAAVISSIVRAFIDRLPEQDQLIFQLRFEGNLPVPQIARFLHLDMQLLYRKLRRHFEDLRVELEKAGVDAGDVAKLSGSDEALLDFRFKTHDPRPSNEEEGSEDEPEVAPEEGA
jgi:RNA polymerase sigma factor (sigma-70 family)